MQCNPNTEYHRPIDNVLNISKIARECGCLRSDLKSRTLAKHQMRRRLDKAEKNRDINEGFMMDVRPPPMIKASK